MRLPLIVIGFTSVIAQVLLIREFVSTFYGNELSLGLILALWLMWVAVGTWLTGRLRSRFELGRRSYVSSLLVVAMILPLQIALIRALRTLLGVTPGALIGFGSMAWSILLLLAPVCLMLGFQFALGSHLLALRGGTVGHAYVLEGVGAATGGLLFSLLLVRVLDPMQICLGLGALNLAAGFFVLQPLAVDRESERHPARWRAGALAIALLLACVALPLGGRLNRTTLAWPWGQALFIEDSPYGRLAVTGTGSQRNFFQNGLLMFETQGAFPEEVAHLPLLQHPRPRSVLLIGGGASGTVREVLKHPVEKVQYVELDPLLIKAAEVYLPPEDRAAFEDRRVSVAYTDGRMFVKQTDERFDVIIVSLPEPSTGQLNRFYTGEFFEEARGALAEGGLFSLGLPSAENYISPELGRRNGSVYHTLLSVFSSVLVLPGEHNFFLCSQTPLSTDHLLLTQRLTERGIDTRWVNAAYLEYLFTTDRFAMTTAMLADVSPIRLNQDLRPICYYYDMVLWLSRFYTNLRALFYATSLISLWWLAVPAVVLVAVVWRFRQAAVPMVIALTGFAQMAIQMTILLAFQALRGYVYGEVALLTAAFMLGITSGGAVTNRLLNRPMERSRVGHRRLFMLLQLAILVYAIILPALMPLAAASRFSELLYPLLALLAGFLGGMEFPLAAHLSKGPAGRVAGLIYGADLAGACFGAALSSVIFIPLLGIPQTCYAVALLALTGWVLLLL
jgi:spermidine synthase